MYRTTSSETSSKKSGTPLLIPSLPKRLRFLLLRRIHIRKFPTPTLRSLRFRPSFYNFFTICTTTKNNSGLLFPYTAPPNLLMAVAAFSDTYPIFIYLSITFHRFIQILLYLFSFFIPIPYYQHDLFHFLILNHSKIVPSPPSHL